jgi:hypothetical protein
MKSKGMDGRILLGTFLMIGMMIVMVIAMILWLVASI